MQTLIDSASFVKLKAVVRMLVTDRITTVMGSQSYRSVKFNSHVEKVQQRPRPELSKQGCLKLNDTSYSCCDSIAPIDALGLLRTRISLKKYGKRHRKIFRNISEMNDRVMHLEL
jgi:hypothetical protein